MFTTLCQSFVGRPRIALLGIVLAIFLAVSLGSSAFGQDSPSKVSGQVLPWAAIAEGDSTRTPLVLTLQDALARAKANDPQFRAALTELGIAHQDTVQSRAQLLPNVNYNMQYVYTQGNGTATGRFLANNGVHEYIAQGNVHQALSPGMFAEYRKTAAAEALARAKAEIATRGLVVTVVQAYYGYVVAQRKYATAQKAASEADHFLGISQKLQNGGEVARSDVIKAQIQNNQTQRELQDALLAMNKTRLDLAVLLFPNFD
jgi:outer membrane protein TolC